MCEGVPFLDKLKEDHELHLVLISFISYYFSKSMLNSLVIGLSIYVIMKYNDKIKTREKVKLDHIYKNLQML